MYSKNWEQKIFTIATTHYFDIIVSEEGVFLMKLPPSTAKATSALFGGLGGAMVKKLETKIGDSIRDLWINRENNLIQNKYKEHAYLFVPKDEIKNKITVKNYLFSSIVTFSGEKKIKLKNAAKEGHALKKQMANIFM